MKLYQIIMEVPDEFIPEEMELTATCKDSIEICSEGFIVPYSMTKNTNDEPLYSDVQPDISTNEVECSEGDTHDSQEEENSKESTVENEE